MIYAIVQYKEDWPGNPGWWRYSRPELQLLTNDGLDRLAARGEAVRYSTVSAGVAQKWVEQDQAAWDRTHGVVA